MAASSVRKFTDPDDYSSSFRDFQYELNVTIGGDFAAEHIRVDLHKLRLQHYSSNLPWVAHTAIPDDRAVFALRAEPGPSLLRAGEEILPTNIERLARGQTIFTRSSGSVSWGTISLSRDALAAIGVATSGRELMTPVDVTTETPHPAAIERLRRLYAVAGRLAKTSPHILAQSEAARSLEHDLVCALAACLGPATNDEDAVAKRRHAVIMRRFRALIAARYDRPVYTTDLCAAIGVSDRTLEICCREHLGMSPQKYLRLRRMQRVRRALTLADPGSATVTGLATANGFWELGRFAMTYRSLYGELPSATLAGLAHRAREEPCSEDSVNFRKVHIRSASLRLPFADRSIRWRQHAMSQGVKKNGATLESNKTGREVLPIPDRPHTGLITYDAKDADSKFPPIEPLLPPKGAPNVLLILMDDAGFGATSRFGGPCSTPNIERLGADGLTYSRFHVCALCAPTRQALLTGRNHHSVGMGVITELATAAPGYSGVRPNTAAPLAQILTLNGYSTAHIGKCHEVPVWQTSQMGPFNQWPSAGGGFEYFYGFLGAEADWYAPDLLQGTTPVDPPKTPEEGYHFDEDVADHVIDWVRQQKALMPEKPFFVYYAPAGTHAPHYVSAEWSDKYKGKFDEGWDKLREQIFARQKELGVIPASAELTARPKEILAWDDVSAILKPVFARQMEVYAGYMEHFDHQMGRVIDALERDGILDDTLVILITGDNGASAEAGPNGTFNWMIPLNGALDLETPEFMASRISDFGTHKALNHYAVGWAHALDTPYQWTKQVASHWGGTRNGAIVRWPKGFSGRGEIRTQFSHVIDIAATILDAAGIPEPAFVNGVQQMPLQGKSLVPTFADAHAPEHRETQYFEMLVNRGIYHKGWSACTMHSVPWVMTGALPAYDDDVWELYAPDDWSQAHNLAATMPDKLRELQRLFLIEAIRYNVLPLDDRKAERFNPEIAGRPTLIRGNSQLLFARMTGLAENIALNIKNKSSAVTAEVVVPDGGAKGVIIAQGGAFGGWSLYVKDGRPCYCYNLFGVRRVKVVGDKPLPTGKHQVRVEFVYDGGALGKGGTVSIYVDGNQTGQGRVDRTEPMIFSADDKLDVGADRGTAVSDDYEVSSATFTGKIEWVQIDIDDDAKNADHLITPEERLKLAIATH